MPGKLDDGAAMLTRIYTLTSTLINAVHNCSIVSSTKTRLTRVEHVASRDGQARRRENPFFLETGASLICGETDPYPAAIVIN
jgi:hypothetical protein